MNYDKIQFVVVPDLREKMNSACDIPDHFDEIMEEYRSKLPNIDTSLVDDYLEGCNNDVIKQHKLWFLSNI